MKWKITIFKETPARPQICTILLFWSNKQNQKLVWKKSDCSCSSWMMTLSFSFQKQLKFECSLIVGLSFPIFLFCEKSSSSSPFNMFFVIWFLDRKSSSVHWINCDKCFYLLHEVRTDSVFQETDCVLRMLQARLCVFKRQIRFNEWINKTIHFRLKSSTFSFFETRSKTS